METIGGHIAWDTADKKLNPVPNVCTTPIVGGQWVKGTDWPFDLKVVTNVTAAMVPVQQDVTPIKY